MFQANLQKWANNNPEKAAFVTLDVPKTAEYYMTVGFNAGFGVTNDGELVALFNDNAPSGMGMRMVQWSKNYGVEYLWCFDGFLSENYKEHGFVVVENVEWNEEYAPEDWNYEKYGRPNVVKMELQE